MPKDPVLKEPYYRQMYNALAADIKNGLYAIGDPLPTERELCELFGVSRHTAREALRQLEQRGMLARRQGSGSTVLALNPSVRYEQSIQSIDDLMVQGSASRLQVLGGEEMAADANQFTSQITLMTKLPCIRVRSIRYLRNDVRPLAVVDTYVAVRNKAQARRLLNTDSAAKEIVTILDPAHLDRIEQAFAAINLDDAAAKLLYTTPGDAAFQTIRNYFDPSDQLLVIAHSLYQGQLFTYTSTLRRHV
ncbi:MAG: GntR family transcriptional regulator [Burkholderiaceae bacterium]